MVLGPANLDLPDVYIHGCMRQGVAIVGGKTMMVRDVTKSALSLSWALSLLGIKQAIDLVQPQQQPRGDVFRPLAQVAVDQLDESMKDLYRSGDTAQARMVDLAFTVFNPQSWIQGASRPGATTPANGGARNASTSFCWQKMVNLMNPMNWTNPMDFLRKVQNCAPCGGQAAHTAQQSSGTAGDAGTAR
jgi:hypothetical protein